MSLLNNRTFIITARNGTFANLQSAWSLGEFSEAEPLYTTDNKKLYVADSNGAPQLVSPGPRVSKTGNYSLNTTWDVGSKFDNQGASGTVVLTLPATWTSNAGVYYEFCCAAAQSFQIKASGGAVINNGTATPSSVNGTITCPSLPYSYLVLEGLGSGVRWVVRSITGTWNVA